MGIRFYCPNGHRLHVKDFLAGKRGICPHCAARFRIPPESEIPRGAPKLKPDSAAAIADNGQKRSQPAAAAPSNAGPSGVGPYNQVAASTVAISAVAASGSSAADPIDEAPDAVWYVRPPSGGQYGPAKGDVMRRWIEEGRVSADSLVWREGWADWQAAGPVFPALGSPYTAPATGPLKREPMSLQLQPATSDLAPSARGAASMGRTATKNKSIAAVVILVLISAVMLGVLIFVLTNKT